MASLSFEPANECSAGPIPEGLKLTWQGGPGGNDFPSTNQQIVINSADGGVVYAFAYIDNRYSVAFVKYTNGVAGPIVEKTNCRYPWALAIADNFETVTVSGQSNQLCTATFAELGIS